MDKQYAAQLEMAERTQNTHPYLLLQRGPMPGPCPVHGKNENLVLPVEHPYWRHHPMRKHHECKCWVRQISRREIARLIENGVQDPDAPPILSSGGLLTGHREKRLVPIKTELVD